MTELKFENEANTSEPIDLNAAEQSVGIAIENAIEQSAGQQSGPVAGNDSAAPEAKGGTSFYDEVLSAKMTGGGVNHGMNILGVGLAVHAESRGRHSKFFPAGAIQVSTKNQPASGPSRFMPSTYGDRVRAARKPPGQKDIMGRPVAKKTGGPADLAERVGISGLSLTGATGCHAKPCAIKGMKADPEAAARLGLVPAYLLTALVTIRRTKDGPMSVIRMIKGAGEGHSDAEQALQKLQQESPHLHAAVQQMSPPKPPTGASSSGKS